MKFRYGYLSLFLAASLLVLSPSRSYGADVVISETIWNGIKIQYAELEKQSGILRANLTQLETELLTAQTQVTLLQTQSETWETLYRQVMSTTKREKGKAYAIAGISGVVFGVIITAIIVSISK